MGGQKRVESVDFWRGIVLVSILFDHIPGNLLEHTTQRNFGFSDGAEVFVFLSGVSVALVYYSKVARSEWIPVVKRCFSRAFRIYGVHVALTIAGIAVFAIAYNFSALPHLAEAHGRGFVFHKPLRGLAGVLMLSQQLGYLNILPIYVVLMLWSPAMLAFARVNAVAALSVSFAVYLVARVLGVSLPSWPEPGTWFLNPFAWQFVFTIGIVAGIKWARTGVPYSSILFYGSMVLILFAAVVVTDGLGLDPGLRDRAYAQLDLLKQNLGLIRLIHFLALAYVVSQVPAFHAIVNTGIGAEFKRLGRHSLAVFAFGTVLSCVGQALLTLVDAQFSDGVEVVGMMYTLFAAAGLFLLARYLERSKRGAPQAAHASYGGGAAAPAGHSPSALPVQSR